VLLQARYLSLYPRLHMGAGTKSYASRKSHLVLK
jgi:hypothetical protein